MYKLKEGIVLKPYGSDSLIDNNNLTDAIAEHLINSGKADLDMFEIEEEVKEVKTNKKQK